MLNAGCSLEAGIVKRSFHGPFTVQCLMQKWRGKAWKHFSPKSAFCTRVLRCEQDLDLCSLDQHCRNEPQDCMFW